MEISQLQHTYTAFIATSLINRKSCGDTYCVIRESSLTGSNLRTIQTQTIFIYTVVTNCANI